MALAGVGRPQGKGLAMSDSTRDEYERGIELYNAGDLEGLVNFYTEDAMLVTPDGTAQGRAAILEAMEPGQSRLPGPPRDHRCDRRAGRHHCERVHLGRYAHGSACHAGRH